jgi:hypothetical protein
MAEPSFTKSGTGKQLKAPTNRSGLRSFIRPNQSIRFVMRKSLPYAQLEPSRLAEPDSRWPSGAFAYPAD